MEDCKTVIYLQQFAAGGDGLARVARAALGMIEDMRLSKQNPLFLSLLSQLVENIYRENGISLLDHLREGADCELCAALMAHVTK